MAVEEIKPKSLKRTFGPIGSACRSYTIMSLEDPNINFGMTHPMFESGTLRMLTADRAAMLSQEYGMYRGRTLGM